MQVNNNRIERYYFTETVIQPGDTLGKYYIGDIPYLHTKKINSLSFYWGDVLTYSPSGVAMAGIVPYGGYLILNDGNMDIIQLPLSDLVNIYEPTNALRNPNGYLNLADLKIDWSKSYYLFPGGVPAQTFPQCLALGVFFK